MDRERELRRARSTLRSLGMGIIIFGFWSLVRSMTLVMVKPIEDIVTAEELADMGPFAAYFRIVLIFVILFILILDLLSRWYVGRTAMKVSQGKKAGRRFTIFSWLLFILWLGLDIASLFLLPDTLEQTQSILETVISFILDITSTVLIGELCFSIRRLKNLDQEEV